MSLFSYFLQTINTAPKISQTPYSLRLFKKPNATQWAPCYRFNSLNCTNWQHPLSNSYPAQDIVILLDVSGSMTGLRKEIAKHVVLNIMETLGEDDFVTVLTFSDETKPLVECFTDSDGEPELVQATTENIAEFTEAVNEIDTMEIANFTSALTAAFTLLERYRTKKVNSKRLET